MNCSEALNLSAGVTSIVGSGGKTTLLRILAHELTETSCAGFTHGPHAGATLILATTTHFLPFANIPLVTSADERVLSCALAHSHSVCVGTPVETGQTQGKLGASPIAFERLSTLADYVIVEADGARHLPLKAHAAHEPCVWPGSVETVLVLGASGLNRPVAQVVHRSALFCERANCKESDLATPKLVAAALDAEVRRGRVAFDKIVINQVQEAKRRAAAAALGRALRACGITVPIFAGSIRASELERLA